MQLSDEEYMRMALEEAKAAEAAGEVPIGAVVANGEGEIVARGHNLRETLNSPSAHAEHLAVEEASKKLNAWRLTGCTVYVTLEPCVMCAGLMHQARIKRCVFGAHDQKAGALETLYQVGADTRLNHNFDVTGGVLAEECATLLTNFFKKKRCQTLPVAGKSWCQTLE